MDAVAQILIEEGHASLSSRRITDEAGVAHGSIRYHFGSVERLVIVTVERETALIITRQREMYAQPIPFRDKWNQAMHYFEQDLKSGYPRLLAEMASLARHDDRCRRAIVEVAEAWSDLLEDAVRGAADQYGLDADDTWIRGVATIIRTSQSDMLDDRLFDFDRGHKELLEVADRLFDWLEGRGTDGPATA